MNGFVGICFWCGKVLMITLSVVDRRVLRADILRKAGVGAALARHSFDVSGMSSAIEGDL